MDESSFETFEKPSVKEVTKHPKVALWHDHTTAHGTEEFKTCQVNIIHPRLDIVNLDIVKSLI